MKTFKKVIAVGTMVIAMVFTSCKGTQLVAPSITSIEGVKIAGASLKGVKGTVKVKIKNTNPVDVKIYKSSVDVKINDLIVGQARVPKKLVIPANSEVMEELSLRPEYSKLGLGDIPSVIKGIKDKSFDLALVGNLKAGKLFNKSLMHVDVAKNVNVEERYKKITEYFTKMKRKLFPKRTKAETDC